MKIIKIITFGILFLPVYLAAQDFPILITEEGHIIVRVNVGDSNHGNFILDTGAGANVLSPNMFNRIKHQATSAGYFTGFRHDGDRLDGAVFEIPFLAIGDYKEEGAIVGVYPPLDDFGIDGLLSLKFFEDKPFTIDYENQKLKFLSEQEANDLANGNLVLPISLYVHTNVLLDIFIPIKLNESIQLLAEFDTGSGHGAYIINTNYIKDLGLDNRMMIEQPYTTQISGEERIDQIYELLSVSVGNGAEQITQNNVQTIFREGLIYNALLGSGMFKGHKITIDIPNRLFIVHD